MRSRRSEENMKIAMFGSGLKVVLARDAGVP